MTATARYQHLPPEDAAALAPKALAAYQANRAAFDREVAEHVAHGGEHGWIDVGTAGKVARFTMPVALSTPIVHRTTMHIGIRGAR